MKTKLIFILSLTFLFLFSGSVYCEEEVKREYWDNGKLKKETLYKDGKEEGLLKSHVVVNIQVTTKAKRVKSA
jgi:hypothetical protein